MPLSQEKFKKMLILSGILMALAGALFLIDFFYVKPKIEERNKPTNINATQNVNIPVNGGERL